MDQIVAHMSFNKIGNEKLIVGSHPWNAADIVDLYKYNGVKAIENLQQSGEPDRGDIDAITAECALLGNRIWYQRVPIQDGSQQSVRFNLPVAVGILNRAITEKAKDPEDKVYLHCCKGLGRSPSVAFAYLYWFRDMPLEDALKLVKSERKDSHPFEDSIRDATNDILRKCGLPADNGDILSKDRDTFKGYVQAQQAVLNA